MIAKTPEQRHLNWADLALDIAKVGHLCESAIPDSERFAALKRVPMFERLDDADLWELVHAGLWSRQPPRTTIVREGEGGKSLFFLGTGQVKVTKQGRLLNVLNAGECVGEMAYIKQGGITRQATVESMSDILLVEFRREALDQVSLRCRYQLSEALMNSLVDRLSLTGERLVRAR